MPAHVLMLIIVFLFSAGGPSWAEFIQLNSGEVIEGKVISRTDDEIKIDTGLGIPVTYYLDEIRQVSDEPPEALPPPSPSEKGHSPLVQEAVEEDQPAPLPLAPESPPLPAAVPGEPAEIQSDAPQPPWLPSQQEAAPGPASLPEEPVKAEPQARPRQEYLLMDKLRQDMETDRQPVPASQTSGDTEDYLRRQWEKQTQLFSEKIRGFIKEWDEKLTQAFKQCVQASREQKYFPFRPGDGTWVIAGLGGVYILYCLPVMLIARKLGLSGLMAWIPPLQLFLLVRMAGRSLLWLFLFLVPVVNVFILLTLCMDVARRLQRPSFVGLLLIIPGLNLLIVWYLAFVRIIPLPGPQAAGEVIARSSL